ncbi:Asp-tRNA(Asn)/Glu-tRNA(Gln) amidotransferase A subunit family amidase [Bradyrhizobium sp. F1.4.3]
MGAIVEEAHPDFRETHECFHVLRAFDFAVSKAAVLRSNRDLLIGDVIWNIEEGLKLTVEQIELAEAQRAAMAARAVDFFKKYDLLLSPATIVEPFAVQDRYVTECDGKRFKHYVDWVAIACAITLACCPALSLPCGFTSSGLPVGLQMVAAPRAEGQLLLAPKCWRIFWACGKIHPSTQGHQREGCHSDRGLLGLCLGAPSDCQPADRNPVSGVTVSIRKSK